MPLPSLPSAAGTIDAKGDQAGRFDFGHVNCFAIGTAETKIARSHPQHTDLLQNLTARSHFHHRPFAVSGDVKVAIDVRAHAIESVIVKLADQPLVHQRLIIQDAKSPNIQLFALIYVQGLVVGTDLDSIRRSHLFGGQSRRAVWIDTPNLARRFSPIRVAGKQRPVAHDREIIGLIHRRIVRQHGDFFSRRVDF
jgi:hypothetical protein